MVSNVVSENQQHPNHKRCHLIVKDVLSKKGQQSKNNQGHKEVKSGGRAMKSKASLRTIHWTFLGIFDAIIIAIPQCLIIRKVTSAIEFHCGVLLLVNSKVITNFQS